MVFSSFCCRERNYFLWLWWTGFKQKNIRDLQKKRKKWWTRILKLNPLQVTWFNFRK